MEQNNLVATNPLLIRVVIQECDYADGYLGLVETLDGISLKQYFSSSLEMLKHDLFLSKNALEFWAKIAPNGYRIVNEPNCGQNLSKSHIINNLNRIL